MNEIFTGYLIFFPVIFPIVLHLIIFKSFPDFNFKRDKKIIYDWIDSLEVKSNNNIDRRIREGDLYDDDDTISTNAGPSIRYPKNVDRAYSGGAERFHYGSGQDS